MIRQAHQSPRKIVLPKIKSKFPFYFGIEWELGTDRPVQFSNYIDKKFKNTFWCVEDGSVDGLELNSYPKSFEYWQKFDGLKTKSKIRGEDAGGIHIHVDRIAFPRRVWLDLITFLHLNDNFVYKIAQRSCSSYAEIVPPEVFEDNINTCDVFGDKYWAVNFRHEKTLEFRIFNSTTEVNILKKNVEFVAALHKFMKSGEDNLDAKCFKRMVNTCSDFPNLVNFMKQRKI